MDFIWNKITEWLKGILIDGITGNLQGLFDNVNQQVGSIAGQVGTTPQAWNSSVFSMIHSLSDNVILPFAGVILAIVMTMELLQLVLEKNNMHDFETWIFFKWMFKTFCAVLIVTNTWNIIMGVFEVAQSVVNSAAGIIGTDASIDLTQVIGDLEARLQEMEIGPLLGLSVSVSVCGCNHSGAEHLHLRDRLRAYDGNICRRIACAYPHGHYDEPRMGADGTKLPAFAVCAGVFRHFLSSCAWLSMRCWCSPLRWKPTW